MATQKSSWLKENKLNLLFIFLLAFLIRLVYFFEIKNTFLSNFLILDSYYYDNWARDIASGHWIGSEVFYGMPFYAYALGLFYSLLGHSLILVKFIQFIVGSISPVLIYLIAEKYFNKSIARISALISLSYGMFIFYEGELVDSSFAIFLYLSTFYLLLSANTRQKARIYLLAGIAFGLSSLCRAGIIPWFVFILIWINFLAKEKQRIKSSVLFALGACAVISLVTLRNYWVGKDFVPITAHSGINLYIGNNNYADGTFSVPPSMSSNSEDLIKDSKIFAEKESGRHLKPSEISGFWSKKAFDFIARNPLKFAKLLLKKTYLFWRSYEIPDVKDYYYVKQQLNFFKFPWFSFSIIAPLSLMGMIFLLNRWKKLFLLYTFVLSYFASILLYFVNSRYRLPVVPALIIFAAYSLYWLFEKSKKREYRKILFFIAIVSAFVFLININTKKYDFSNSLNNAGDILLKQGRFEEAEDYYKRSIRENDKNAKPYNDLGVVYIGMNRLGKAQEYIEKAMDLDPYNPRAHSNMGLIYFKNGEFAKASDEFNKALELNPGLSEARNNLGVTYIKMRNEKMAIEEFREAIRINDSDLFAHYNLGLLYVQGGLIAEAKEEFRKTLALSPGHQAAAEWLKKLEARGE